MSDAILTLGGINLATLAVVCAHFWRSGKAWGSLETKVDMINHEKLPELTTEVKKTNGTVRDHETRISTIEGAHGLGGPFQHG